MATSDRSKLLPANTQQREDKVAFLIDCDGGLSRAFYTNQRKNFQPELIEDFPLNSEIFLFYNSNDLQIVERMDKVKSKRSNVHLFPNLKENCKNGADVNLAFILGTISHKYNSYFIIAPPDGIYQELSERLKYTYPKLKARVELRQFSSPKELKQYVQEIVKVQTNLFDAGVMFAEMFEPITVTFTPENLFHLCPLESWQQSSHLYRFAELIDHLNKDHPDIIYNYCSICQEMDRGNKWSKHQCKEFENHVQKERYVVSSALSIRYFEL